jgi:GNAT superfamily N-acetyltransferase
MKDIPMFTTDSGVSSLILKEIPYKQLAFIHVQDVKPGQLKPHLEECISFCRMVGAEKILAKGHEELENYPLESVVVEMTLLPQQQEPEANLWPVTQESVAKWREVYNQAMGKFDNHATLTFHDEKRIVQSGGAYFVHRDGTLLGIGWMDGQELLALVSVIPGMGETVARTLFTTVGSDKITLEVVSDNLRAVRLYERMGFVKTREVSRWYRLL